ncbi:hypothetical protein KSP40_PGU010224 [Platanthera guangdongensis]|uniref:FAF domain-containing protein n=1 Tax=Platanthera guangdongensis TaxID=2320717 RepID=A0ABR2MKG9_9ASPA
MPSMLFPAAFPSYLNSNSTHFLDMCTENLGCETGANCSANEIEAGAVIKMSPSRPAKLNEGKRMAAGKMSQFPPPITTLFGQERLRLARKREGGRLLMFPFKPSLLEADRSDGRVLLRFLPSGVVKEKEESEAEEHSPKNEEDKGFITYGGGMKFTRVGRCIEEQGGGSAGKMKTAAVGFFNSSAFCVAGS